MKKHVLVVGAGFAGAVIARILADAGIKVQVIDQRDHIAGNAFDKVDARGVRIHRYGPHLFHTNNMKVVEWLSGFTDWIAYEHRVSALLPDGRLAPLPINRTTLEMVFGVKIADAEAGQAFLAKIALPIAAPRNAEEYLLSRIGSELTELFFARYTLKMWGHSLAEMDASVVQRIPIRFDDERRYFPNDSFQALPRHGYTALFERILSHPAITVALNQAFQKDMLVDYDFAFLSMPIDEFYDFDAGRLPYRSIRFHHEAISANDTIPPSVSVNFTDNSPYTRKTYWHLLPEHSDPASKNWTTTVEEPCNDYDNNNERYYPVKSADGRYQAIYKTYHEIAAHDEKIAFIGRCGTYQYLDMHQVINQSMLRANQWLATHG